MMSVPALGRTSVLVVKAGQPQQHARGMATLKDISMRLKSIKNTQKITQSMKMVSAAKYARAERELRATRPLGEGAKVFYERAEVGADVDEEKKPQKLFIAITSDRGLCGAVHTSVSRTIRMELQKNSDNIKVVCIGDKSKAILQRLYGKNIAFVASEVGRKPPTFLDAALVTNELIKSNVDYDVGKIIYNRFKSVVSYITSEMPLFKLDAVAAAPKLATYDSVDDDVIKSYLEFSMASMIFYAMKEGACSEQSSRMTAMDGASKNAGEVITKLTLTYNRTRQAVITRELIEIISGAAALDKS